LLVVVAAAVMALLSLSRYGGHNTRAFDLGMMSQAVWTVLDGQPLVFTAQGVPISRLARHVEFIYFAIAPVYALFPSPATLLVIQALVYALAAIPVWRIANRRLDDKRAALALALVYLLYPVGMTAVLFEFHADVLAMSLLLFMLDALDKRSRGWYVFWLILALACKFYVAIPVAVLGALLWWRGERTLGQATLLVSLFWGALAFLVVRPLFAPQDLAQASALKATTASYLDFYFGPLDSLRPRIANAMIVFLPSLLLLGWRAPMWLLPAAAVAVPVLLSGGPGPSYDYRFHHYAITVPFLVVAIIYGASAMRERATKLGQEARGWARAWYRLVIYTLGLTALLAVLLVDMPLNPLFYRAPAHSGLGLDATGYGKTSRDDLRATWLESRVPEHAPVATDRLSGLHLVNRPILYLTHGLKTRTFEQVMDDVDYVVVDALHDFALATDDHVYEGGVKENWPALRTVLADPTFGLTQARDGLLVFERDATGMKQEVGSLNMTGAGEMREPVQLFGDAVALHDATIADLGDGQHEAILSWSALPGLAEMSQLFAVSRLQGVTGARIVHLPTMSLLPTTSWPSDRLIRETITFALPEDLPAGKYEVWVSWYDSSVAAAAATDERSRVGEELLIGTVEASF
jgi:uncharacterized membrane protein